MLECQDQGLLLLNKFYHHDNVHENVFGGGELAFLEKITKKIMSKFETNKEPKQDEIIELILNCKNEYLNKISNFDKKAYFTDKAPLNFRYIGIIKPFFLTHE